MSTINCTDKNCVHQKDGKCEFNSVTSGKIAANGHCVHYCSAEQPQQQWQKNKFY